ncbi:hypothetical protein BVG79_02058 [Ketogulonicigenium robustum]|uniref:FlgN family protein n=1 Tax=Ketogulonicigenium robustum TaxID=92947 RepID=A0A1W6P1L5_9RHOB|nr:hypothetical protein [Ketogulonicigenium robustum]ARO15398.1 hypothetical protein BVG79_02058 [Ketogulonicigenium robustum]
MADPLHTRALALFDAERQALLHADFDALATLLTQKESLAAALDHAELAPAVVADIARAAQRNQNLFAAAIRGLRTARTQAAPPSFSTYSQAGTRAAFQATRPAFEHKA